MEKIKTNILKMMNSLHASFYSDDLSLEGLELRLLTTEELIQTGFVDKNVKAVLPPEDADTIKHVHEFFETQCKHVMPGEIDPIYSPPEPISYGEYVDYFKYGVVRGVVKNKIIDYIETLKNCSNNLNRKTSDDGDDLPF